MALSAGTRLGGYEVIDAIGAGGMGEVYRARDTKLGREVALKVLSDHLAADPDRLARFEREAQLLASLNHPHIAQIYGAEDSGGVRALVMELVAGPTLADRIAAGPLALDEALANARQIADALEAAHEKGIVHRDLKPANIKLTPNGLLKVLDFGLAKLIEGDTAATGGSRNVLTMSPTLSLQATIAGLILGTASYMSPEQARGRPVDRRTDIWAFGCVLYEMLTGARAFAGEDIADTIGAVIHKPVDWTRLPREVPPPVRATLQRCLEKDPKQRVRDIGDVQLALVGGFESAPVAAVSSAASRRSYLLLAAVVLAAVAVTAAIVAALMRQSPTPAQVMRFSIVPPATYPIQPFNADRQLAVSPDGQLMAFVAGQGAGSGGPLVMRRLDSVTIEPIAGVQGRAPFFSPDGQWLGFFQGISALQKVSIGGGAPATICPIVGAPRGASWVLPDAIVFATTDATTGLLMVNSAGGEPTVLTKPDPARGEVDHVLPTVLPNGRAVLFTIFTGQRENAQIAVLDLQTRQTTTLIRGGSHAQYVESGHIVYAAGGTMRAVRFDAEALQISGDSEQLPDQPFITPLGVAQFAVSRTGTLLHLTGGGDRESGRTLIWVDRSGTHEPVKLPPGAYNTPRVSPRGDKVALSISDDEQDIWTWDIQREALQRITVDRAADFAPVWASDGQRLVFASARTGVPNLYSHASDGSGTDVRLTTSLSIQIPGSFTPDGEALIVQEETATGGGDLRRLRIDGAASANVQTEPLISSRFRESAPEISPDGRWIAYYSDESGQNEVYVRSYPNVDAGLWKISTAGGTRPAWSRDGRELFYFDPNTAMMSVDIQTTPAFTASRPKKLFDGPWSVVGGGRTYDVSHDGRRFLMLRDEAGAPLGATATIYVVLNWTEELKRLVK